MKKIKIKDFYLGPSQGLLVIAGPCVIESEQACFEAAAFLKDLMQELGLPFVFKASYDKANRSSLDSYRGPGLKKGLSILERISKELDLPVLTDVHSPQDAIEAASVCEILQIPAFLCRQTDLVLAAAQTNAVINIKKGQFMEPSSMRYVLDKALSTGNERVFLTERGFCFGYGNLVSDMRAIHMMQDLGVPVCFDATHSVQLPGSKVSGGQRQYVALLAKAAVAAGANAVFLETHADPQNALSDPHSMIPFHELKPLLGSLKAIYELVQKEPSSKESSLV